jgi:DNA primase
MTDGTAGGPRAHKLSERLAEHIDSLVPALLPGARRTGGYWSAGNVQGDTGGSLYIHRAGPRSGRWVDAATGQFGDMLDLINAALFGAQDLRAAIRWTLAWLGLDPACSQPSAPPRASQSKPHRHDGDEAAICAARSIWRAARPIGGSLAERYLRCRAVAVHLPLTLRYAPALLHHATGLALPALIAAISGPDGKVTAVQRIYLRADGTDKASVNCPKMTVGRTRDSACRLAPAGRELGLAEGIETSLSAMELYRIPVWAACGSRLDAIAIPDAVERLIIFADNGTAGVRAAERAAIAHKGAVPEIAVCFPPQPHKDWNDMLKADSAGSGPNGR